MAETESREDLQAELADAVEGVHGAAAETDRAADGMVEAVAALVDAGRPYAHREMDEREARRRVMDLRRKLGARTDGQAPSVELPDGPEARLKRQGGRLAVKLVQALRKAAGRGEL